MLGNFMIADVLGSTAAAVLLGVFLVPTGYVASWFADLFCFREQSFAMRIAISSPLAVAILPVAIYLVGASPYALWLGFAAIWIAFALLMVKQFSMGLIWDRAREMRIGIALAAGWALIAIGSLADLQFNDRLYFSTSAYDHSVRSAFTAAAAREYPPENPFFASRPAVTLRYHHFWMLICSLPSRLAGLAPRHALYGGTVWAGISLMSLIVVGLRFFMGIRARFGRACLIGVGLLAVTGLDLLPNLYLSHFKAPMYADPEWWNTQIASWADSLLWVPHHVASMIACFTGFLVLRQHAATKRRLAVHIGIAGLALASACGLSTLVSFTFAAALGFWALIALVRRWWDEISLVFAAGVVAAVFAFPYAYSTLLPSMNGAGGEGFLGVAVREFTPAMRMLTRHTQWNLPSNLVNFLLLPVNYLFELGFFLLVAVLRLKQIRAAELPWTREETAAWTMVGTSFLIGTFLRSTSLSSNDLGWRCFLQAQFVFLLWAAPLVDRWYSGDSTRHGHKSHWLQRTAVAMMALGVLGTLYQVIDLRVYSLLFDRGIVRRAESWLDDDRRSGLRTYSLRSAYETLSASLPPDAVVQYNPLAPAFIPHLLYSGHRAAIGLPNCGIHFGGDPAICRRRTDLIVPLFIRPSLDDSNRLEDICREFGINALVVANTDPVWAQPDSWVWSRKPFLANSFARVFRLESTSLLK